MLFFRVNHFELGDRHFLLLPKLNQNQMEVIGKELADEGFSVTFGSCLKAMSSECSIHVEQIGLCWSSSDPSDYLLPLIPRVLACEREAVSQSELLGMYFRLFLNDGRPAVRFDFRLESLGNWDRLRSTGGCGLAPDEHLLARFLLSESRGACPMITDFAVEGSVPFYSGRKLYYRSVLPATKASDTLRLVGSRKQNNSYISRDGTLLLGRHAHEHERLTDCLEALGEWCSFRVAKRESSNWRPGWPCPAPVV